MPTSKTEELGRFLKCTVIGRGVFGPCACCLVSPRLATIEEGPHPTGITDQIICFTRSKLFKLFVFNKC